MPELLNFEEDIALVMMKESLEISLKTPTAQNYERIPKKRAKSTRTMLNPEDQETGEQTGPTNEELH